MYKVYDYLKRWIQQWYLKFVQHQNKIQNLGSKIQIIELKYKNNTDYKKFWFRLDYNMKFDILLVIPIINRSFDLNNFRKLIPYGMNGILM